MGTLLEFGTMLVQLLPQRTGYQMVQPRALKMVAFNLETLQSIVTICSLGLQTLLPHKVVMATKPDEPIVLVAEQRTITCPHSLPSGYGNVQHERR